jgi:hypothetical protein
MMVRDFVHLSTSLRIVSVAIGHHVQVLHGLAAATSDALPSVTSDTEGKHSTSTWNFVIARESNATITAAALANTFATSQALTVAHGVALEHNAACAMIFTFLVPAHGFATDARCCDAKLVHDTSITTTLGPFAIQGINDA